MQFVTLAWDSIQQFIDSGKLANLLITHDFTSKILDIDDVTKYYDDIHLMMVE